MAPNMKAMLEEFRLMYAVEQQKSSPDKKQLARLTEKINRVKTMDPTQSASKNKRT